MGYIAYVFLITVVGCLTGHATDVDSRLSHIQLNGPVGIEVYLDDQFSGRTSAKWQGLIIHDVPPGHHVLRFEREGFTSMDHRFELPPDTIYVYRIESFIPEIEISQEGDFDEGRMALRVGRIVVKSLPIDCWVTIESIANAVHKRNVAINFDNVPPGVYHSTYSIDDQHLAFDLEVLPSVTTEVLADFVHGEVLQKHTLLHGSERSSADDTNHTSRGPSDQEPAPYTTVVDFFSVDKPPVMIGGTAALYKMVKFPELAEKAGVEGVAMIVFTVTPNGIPADFEVRGEKPKGLGFADAAIEALRQMRFQPGYLQDKVAAVRMSQTIRFTVD